MVGTIIEFNKNTRSGMIRSEKHSQISFKLYEINNFNGWEMGWELVGARVKFEIGQFSDGKLYAVNLEILQPPTDKDSIYKKYRENWRTQRYYSYSENVEDELKRLEEIDKIHEEEYTIPTPSDSTNVVKDILLREANDSELIALALFERKIRVVSLTKDGKYRFLDEAESHHNIVYPSFFEEISLQLAIEEFEDLINSPRAKENDFQKFFERNQDFILNDDYKQAHPHIVLSKENEETLIPDFILEPVDQNSFCDLLELKLPTADIFVLKKNRERYSAAIFEAAAQLREYGKYFDEEKNRSKFQQIYPHLRVYKPRMFVIIGRQNSESLMKKREIQAEFPQLFLKTYDELLARMKWKKDKLENKNKLF